MQKLTLERYQHLSPVWKTVRSVKESDGGEVLLDEIRSKIAERNSFPHREILVSALHRQYGSAFENGLHERIDLLKSDTTFTVTTGHQIGLFGGPAFFFYKIITTLRLAEELQKREPGKTVIPVLWMATEDHDKEEIASVSLFGKTLTWETEQSGAVGQFSTDSIETLLAELDQLKGSLPFAEEVMQIFRKAYAPGKTLASATREWVHAFFGEKGLLIIDGNDPELKRLFREVMEQEILEHPTNRIVQEENNLLTERGLSTQVHPREINLFYLSNNSRKRIVKSESGYVENDGNLKWSREEILAELGSHPERFSPNVLLRPLYQEIILPNLAYIGGPGELSYWMQIGGVFRHFKVAEPVCFPRNSVMVVEQNHIQRMEKLGLELNDLFTETEELIQQFLQKNAGEEMDLSEEMKRIEEEFTKLAVRVSAVDSTLKALVLAEMQKALKSLEHIGARIRKSEKAKHETSLNQIKTLREKLFPGGVPQERVESLLPHLWKYGKPLLSEIKSTTDPLDFRYVVLFPDLS